MRINKFLARFTTLSRRSADKAIVDGKVTINGSVAQVGINVSDNDTVSFAGKTIKSTKISTLLLLNKPVGYVCSRNGQGSKTVYELLPSKYRQLNPIGRLDKDSSGLILLTDDGDLSQRLAHPSFNKQKIYQVTLTKKITPVEQARLDTGISLNDGVSNLKVTAIERTKYLVKMSEGRNRQIRRTFKALGLGVVSLHRTHFGEYSLEKIPKPGNFIVG